jgi:O-antigen/teichoic acid export membrane protein
MIKWLKEIISKSAFISNSLTLISGNVIAHIATLILTPILTRLYTQAQFGELSIITAIVLLFGNIVGGKYEYAILLTKRNKFAVNIVFLGLILSLIFSVFLTLVFIFLNSPIANLLKAQSLKKWLPLVSIPVFTISAGEFFKYYFTKHQKYYFISKVKVIKTWATITIQTLLGFITKGKSGLIEGYIGGQIIGLYPYWKLFKTEIKKLKTAFNLKLIYLLAYKYKKFPIFNVPSSVAHRLYLDVYNFLIPILFGINTLGLFSLAYRLMTIPNYLIAQSFAQVFLQKISEKIKNNQNIDETTKYIGKKILIVGFSIFLVVFLFAKPVFPFIFGKSWAEAGLYIKILTPYFFMRFLTTSLNSIFYALEKQQIVLVTEVFLLIISAGSLILGHILNYNALDTIKLFSFSLALGHFLVLILIYYAVVSYKKRTPGSTIANAH